MEDLSEGTGAVLPAATAAAVPTEAPPTVADILGAGSQREAIEKAGNLWKAAVENKNPAAQAALVDAAPFDNPPVQQG